jgi:hypothetical protein
VVPGVPVRASRGILWVDFAKGQRKDDVAQEYLAGGVAVPTAAPNPWIVAETGVVKPVLLPTGRITPIGAPTFTEALRWPS